MRSLSLTVAHQPDEALHSFVGRTAARNGVGVASFCRELALDLVGVANGADHAIGRLTELTGADHASLRRNALIKREDRTWTLDGEVIDWHMLRRLDARVCPVCLTGDAAAHAGPSDQAAYCRTHWLVDQIRTCPIHAVELVALPPRGDGRDTGRSDLHDFVGRLAAAWGGSAGLPIRPTFVSGLEAYLHGRLRGGAGDPWLDGLPFNVVATFTERLGVAVLHGPNTRFGQLGSQDWKVAGDAGWQVMRLGEEGLRDFACMVAGDPDVGLRDSFGEFWPFVMRVSRKPEYTHLCAMLTSRLQTTRVSIPRRLTREAAARDTTQIRLSTASAEYRRNTDTLRRVLASRGLLRPGQEDIAASRVILERDAVADAMADLGRRMSLVEAARHLNAPNRQVSLLLGAGLLGGADAERRRGVNLTVDRDDLDAFMRNLVRDAVERERPLPGEGTLMQASRSARRPFADVVRLVIEGRLGWVGRQVGVTGVSSVLVRPEDVRTILNGGEVTGPTIIETSRILRISHPGVAMLVADDHLLMMTVRQRRTGQRHQVVRPESLRAFQTRYVSISSLACQRGVHPHALRAELNAAGVRLALPNDRYRTSIYHVDDVRGAGDGRAGGGGH